MLTGPKDYPYKIVIRKCFMKLRRDPRRHHHDLIMTDNTVGCNTVGLRISIE